MKLNAHAFAAVAQAMSTEETRYYPNGVLVEPDGTMVATDGQVLLVAKLNDCDGLPDQSVIIRPEKTLLTAAKKRNAQCVKFADGINGPAQVVTENGAVVGVGMASVVDATYPDWRAVVEPATRVDLPSQEPSVFNTTVMTQLISAAKIATQSRTAGVQLIAQPDTPSPVYFADCDWIAGVVMPMRKSAVTIDADLSRLL